MSEERDKIGRTHFSAMLEVQYGIQYNGMLETYFLRLARGLTLTTLLVGTFAISNLVKDLGGIPNGIVGVIVALCGLIQVVYQPATASIGHRDAKKAFYDLNAELPGLTIEEAYARIDRIRTAAPNGLRSFARPAFNRAMRSQGQTNAVKKLRRLESVADFMA